MTYEGFADGVALARRRVRRQVQLDAEVRRLLDARPTPTGRTRPSLEGRPRRGGPKLQARRPDGDIVVHGSAQLAQALPSNTMSPSGPSLQLRDLLDNVATEDRRVRPCGVVERRGDDVLRHRVELVGELAIALWRRIGEALVGRTASVALHGLVDLELSPFLAAVELEAPAPVPEVLGPAGILRRHNPARRTQGTILAICVALLLRPDSPVLYSTIWLLNREGY